MSLRDAGIEKRRAGMNGHGHNFSQMHFARRGVLTEEMEFVARREKTDPELVRSEIARGPSGTGASFCKIARTVI